MSDQPQQTRRLSGVTMRILLFASIPLMLAACQSNSLADPKVSAVITGDSSPDFSLHDTQKNQNDPPITLSQLVDKGPVVIVFHRGLTCPPCMQHLAEIAAHNADFKALGIQIIAIGPDPVSAASRDAIISFDAFPFPLLSDPDDKVAAAYGLKVPDGSMLEGTFIVDQNRRLRLAERSNNPVGEVSELLSAGKSALVAR